MKRKKKYDNDKIIILIIKRSNDNKIIQLIYIIINTGG